MAYRSIEHIVFMPGCITSVYLWSRSPLSRKDQERLMSSTKMEWLTEECCIENK